MLLLVLSVSLSLCLSLSDDNLLDSISFYNDGRRWQHQPQDVPVFTGRVTDSAVALLGVELTGDFVSELAKVTEQALCLLSVRLSVRPSVRPSVCPSVRLTLCVRPSSETASVQVLQSHVSSLLQNRGEGLNQQPGQAKPGAE